MYSCCVCRTCPNYSGAEEEEGCTACIKLPLFSIVDRFCLCELTVVLQCIVDVESKLEADLCE